MVKKKFLGSCIIAVVISATISLFPLLISAIDDSSDFSYNNFNVTANVNSDGSVNMHEEFYLDTDSDSHTYIREIYFSKNKKVSYSNENQASFDTSSFKIKVENNGEVIEASYDNPLNPYLGKESDNIIAFEGQKNELGDKIYCSENKNYCHKVEIFLKAGINKNTKYIIDYKLENVVNVFNDVSEINWNFVPGLNATKKNVNLTINLPENNFTLAESDENFDPNKIYYYGAGSSKGSFLAESNNRTIKAYAKKLKSNESLEVLTYFSSSIMNVENGVNRFNYDGLSLIKENITNNLNEEARYASLHNTYLVIGIVTGGLFLLGVLWLFIHVYKKYDKELTSSFTSEYFRELPAHYPPAEMGYLYREEEVTKDDLNATLMDLIRRGYVSVNWEFLDENGKIVKNKLTDKKPNYQLIYNRNKDVNELKSYEKLLLEWYFDVIAGGNDSLTLDDIDSFVKTESNAKTYNSYNKKWLKLVYEEGCKKKFFDRYAQTAKKKFSFILIVALLLVIVNFRGVFVYSTNILCVFNLIILSSVFVFILYANQIRRRTEKGNEDYVRWKAFKKFLEDFSQFENYPVPGIKVWEHYLVYATSFGIAELVEKQLRTKFKELDRLEEYESSYVCYSGFHYYMHIRLNQTIAIGNQTIASAQAQRMASSGKRGGNGSFGGGSFGGGGGGFSGVR